MKRREFITLLGGAAATWPQTVRAQQPTMPVIGFLGVSDSSAMTKWVAALVQRLRELGWVEGRNIAIEYRWAEGRFERLTDFAAELVRLKVNIIIAADGTAATLAARHATSIIPIVFPIAGDPVTSGLVASLGRPGGNVTGLSILASDLAGKRLEFLREIVSGLRRFAILANVDSPNAVLEMAEVQAAARILGLEVAKIEIRQAEDIAPAVAALKDRAQALYVAPDPVVLSSRAHINTLALDARLPTIYASRDFVEAGGLMSYGPSVPDQFRRAAELVDKILRGAKPGDLPVEQPTKFELVINLKTANALGLDLPPALLARADEVIE